MQSFRRDRSATMPYGKTASDIWFPERPIRLKRSLADPGGGQPGQCQPMARPKPFWPPLFKDDIALKTEFSRVHATIFIELTCCGPSLANWLGPPLRILGKFWKYSSADFYQKYLVRIPDPPHFHRILMREALRDNVLARRRPILWTFGLKSVKLLRIDNHY